MAMNYGFWLARLTFSQTTRVDPPPCPAPLAVRITQEALAFQNTLNFAHATQAVETVASCSICEAKRHTFCFLSSSCSSRTSSCGFFFYFGGGVIGDW